MSRTVTLDDLGIDRTSPPPTSLAATRDGSPSRPGKTGFRRSGQLQRSLVIRSNAGMIERAASRSDAAVAASLRHAPPWVIRCVNRRRAELRLLPLPTVAAPVPLPEPATTVCVATARGLRAKATAALARLTGGVGSAGKPPLHARPHARSARVSGVFSMGTMP